MSSVPAKMSNVLRLVLRKLFFNTENGFDFRKGVLLPLDLPILFAKYKCLVADESALHLILLNMGASGHRPCPVHFSVCQPSAARPLAAGDVDLKCVDFAHLRAHKHTDETVREVLRELQTLRAARDRGDRGASTAYANAQTEYGWHDDPNSLLEDPDLGVGAISTLMHCYVHMYIVSGIFQVEMQFLLHFLIARGHPVHDLHTFVNRWVWPKHTGEPRDMFSTKNVNMESDKFKCDAHEALSVYAIVAVFLQIVVPPGTCDAQVMCFLLLADVLDLLSCVKSDTVDSEQLRTAIEKHLVQFLVAYGGNGWLVKHHLALDLADALARFTKLLSLLVLERKHKVTKRWSRDRFSLKTFEHGLMQDLTLSHLEQLSVAWCEDGLVDPTTPTKKFAECLSNEFGFVGKLETSRVARVRHGRLVHAGDYALALIDGVQVFCEVLFHVESDGRRKSCLCIWEPDGAALCVGTANFKRPTHGEYIRVVDLDSIIASVVALISACKSRANAIVPPYVRG